MTTPKGTVKKLIELFSPGVTDDEAELNEFSDDGLESDGDTDGAGKTVEELLRENRKLRGVIISLEEQIGETEEKMESIEAEVREEMAGEMKTHLENLTKRLRAQHEKEITNLEIKNHRRMCLVRAQARNRQSMTSSYESESDSDTISIQDGEFNVSRISMRSSTQSFLSDTGDNDIDEKDNKPEETKETNKDSKLEVTKETNKDGICRTCGHSDEHLRELEKEISSLQERLQAAQSDVEKSFDVQEEGVKMKREMKEFREIIEQMTQQLNEEDIEKANLREENSRLKHQLEKCEEDIAELNEDLEERDAIAQELNSRYTVLRERELAEKKKDAALIKRLRKSIDRLKTEHQPPQILSTPTQTTPPPPTQSINCDTPVGTPSALTTTAAATTTTAAAASTPDTDHNTPTKATEGKYQMSDVVAKLKRSLEENRGLHAEVEELLIKVERQQQELFQSSTEIENLRQLVSQHSLDSQKTMRKKIQSMEQRFMIGKMENAAENKKKLSSSPSIKRFFQKGTPVARRTRSRTKV